MKAYQLSEALYQQKHSAKKLYEIAPIDTQAKILWRPNKNTPSYFNEAYLHAQRVNQEARIFESKINHESKAKIYYLSQDE